MSHPRGLYHARHAIVLRHNQRHEQPPQNISPCDHGIDRNACMHFAAASVAQHSIIMPDGLLRGLSFRVGFLLTVQMQTQAPSLRLVSPVHSATGSWCSASMIVAPVRLDDDARVSDSSSSAPQTSNAGDDEAGSRRPTSFFPWMLGSFPVLFLVAPATP